MKKQTTYSMLINSKEKGRDMFEAAVYAVVGLCAVAMVGHGALQSNGVRAHASLAQAPAAPMVAKAVSGQRLAARF
jgi:hypothetical protein